MNPPLINYEGCLNNQNNSFVLEKRSICMWGANVGDIINNSKVGDGVIEDIKTLVDSMECNTYYSNPPVKDCACISCNVARYYKNIIENNLPINNLLQDVCYDGVLCKFMEYSICKRAIPCYLSLSICNCECEICKSFKRLYKLLIVPKVVRQELSNSTNNDKLICAVYSIPEYITCIVEWERKSNGFKFGRIATCDTSVKGWGTDILYWYDEVYQNGLDRPIVVADSTKHDIADFCRIRMHTRHSQSKDIIDMMRDISKYKYSSYGSKYTFEYS